VPETGRQTRAREVPFGRAGRSTRGGVLYERSVRGTRAGWADITDQELLLGAGCTAAVAAWTLRSTARRYRSFTLNSANMPSSVCGGPSVGASMAVVPTGTKHATE
jgi:hypothetical protein